MEDDHGDIEGTREAWCGVGTREAWCGQQRCWGGGGRWVGGSVTANKASKFGLVGGRHATPRYCLAVSLSSITAATAAVRG